jgi:hypothetical protein
MLWVEVFMDEKTRAENYGVKNSGLKVLRVENVQG